MDIFNIISLLGGLGMFLFGMKIMDEGLERSAGDKLKGIIESITSNIFKSVLVGALVTALIQSSSATTVMVVGFVNAGMMNLTQAVGVIMGANIGTTITAQILRLGDISSNVWYMQMLKPTTLAPAALIVGVLLIFTAGRKKHRADIGYMITGFGVLFVGMQNMERSVSALKDIPQFINLLTAFENPILGVMTGAGVTGIMQSSSASVGILQAVASTGAVTFAAAVPIIMGQNIGTCITALLSSIGASKNAKKAAMIHLYFNIIGTVIFLTAIYLVQNTVGFPFWNKAVNRGDIADFHTLFNIVNTLLLIPFAGGLVKLANMSIKGKDPDERETFLDKRFLSTPSLAISQSNKEIIAMFRLVKENLNMSSQSFREYSDSRIKNIARNEMLIDSMEIEITRYLTKITENSLNIEENKIVTGYFYVARDIERIGDNIDNITKFIVNIHDNKLTISERATQEIHVMFNAVSEIIDMTIAAVENNDLKQALAIEPLEQVIDVLKETLRNKHIERLNAQKCQVKSGLVFIETINNLERVADHCSNIGVMLLGQKTDVNNFNSHEYLRQLHADMPEDFKKDYEKYIEKYTV